MKYLLIVPFLICYALILFATAVFLAWVFAGMYVSEDLSTRAFFGAIAGMTGIFFIFLLRTEA